MTLRGPKQMRPFQVEVVRVPIPSGLGICVQAKHLVTGDCWHHDHTFPGTKDGDNRALDMAFKVALSTDQDWTPGPPHWFNLNMVDRQAWINWRRHTGRR